MSQIQIYEFHLSEMPAHNTIRVRLTRKFPGRTSMRLHHELDIIWKRSLPQLPHQAHRTAIYLEYVSRRDVSRWRMLSEAPRTYCAVHTARWLSYFSSLTICHILHVSWQLHKLQSRSYSRENIGTMKKGDGNMKIALFLYHSCSVPTTPLTISGVISASTESGDQHSLFGGIQWDT